KTGATWSLSNTHVNAGPVSPLVDPLYVFDFTVVAANDLPLVWSYGTGP
ncbi:MAG: hypothetical protein QOH36_1447, partial [Actinomycetota bacterium]|nr:hypothetical protein [Actinomycetota bacterium]